MSRRVLKIAGLAATACVGWGWFEAGWLRCRRVVVPLPSLRRELRIVHLSDLHLGLPSRGSYAVDRAVRWARARDPDVICITGDLVSRPRGNDVLQRLVSSLGTASFAVLGNHEIEHTRDPFSRTAALTDLGPVRLLVDETASLDISGTRVQIVGVDPRSYRQHAAAPWRLADTAADVRILLCHFPLILDQLPRGAFDLVLSGHMHDGQISVPLPWRKLRLAHPRARYTSGLYERAGTVMHVSPGLGTTFVPFRFFARPEVTELVLQPGP